MSPLSFGKTRKKINQKKEEKLKRNVKFALFGSVLGVLFAVATFPFGYAQEPQHIGIEWSNTCISLFLLDDFETCGNPVWIKSAYLQSPLKPTSQKMFDDMAKTDKADYQKRNIYNNHVKSCIKENYCNVFEPRTSVYYWYDLNADSRPYMDKIITINANMKHTNLNTVNDEIFVNATTRTLILDTNQINIESCRIIAYAPEYYRMFLEMGGLMWYVLDDCLDDEKLGILSEPYKETHNLTKIRIDESPAWLYLQELEALKTKYKENRLGTD